MGDSLYIGSCSGNYYAFDRASGEIRWRYDTAADGAPASFHGDPLITDDVVITGSDHALGGHVYAFDIATGEVVWKRDVGGLETDLVLSGSAAIGGTSEGGLIALDIESGAVVWRFERESLTQRSAFALTPAVKGETIYFGGRDGVLYALSAASGEEVWSTQLGGTVSTPTRIVGSQLYIGTHGNELIRLDAATGEIRARLELDDFPHHSLVPVGDCLVVLIGEPLAACVDPDLREVRWSRATEDEWTTYNPLVLGETVLLGSAAGDLEAINLADGTLAWDIELEGMLRGLGATGDALYVGTFSGTVYALALEP